MLSKIVKWVILLYRPPITALAKAKRIDKEKVELHINYCGIDCRVNIQPIGRGQYGLGVTSSTPMAEEDISSIHRYLIAEGFVDR